MILHVIPFDVFCVIEAKSTWTPRLWLWPIANLQGQAKYHLVTMPLEHLE